jgi:hypothetical protein
MNETAARFSVKCSTIKNEGGWDHTLVEIHDGDTKIGEYRRNYPSFGETTFCPFELSGTWYALYSRNYTSTRIMRLPDCVDLGGEEPNSVGFCPVEYHVPLYQPAIGRDATGAIVAEQWRTGRWAGKREDGEEWTIHDVRFRLGPARYLPFAFIAGCIWGDDTSWKVELIDLRRVAEGKIERSPRFGHIELPHKMSLLDCIEVSCHRPLHDLRVDLIRQECRDLATGDAIDPYE